MGKTITAFAGVFEQRLALTKRSLKKELEKEKSDRRRDIIKKMISEIRGLEEYLKDMRVKCPNCGHEL